MGLTSGPKGAKAALRSRAPTAFADFDSLHEIRASRGAFWEQTTACIDGNVLAMGTPSSVRSLDDHVHALATSVASALQVASLVVLVFDEPAFVTGAKQEVQKRRDARVPAVEFGDAYGTADLEDMEDCRPLKLCRAARMRFFDELAKRVLCAVCSGSVGSSRQGVHGLLVDGVDPRGASRPVDASRDASLLGTNEELVRMLRRGFAIGEGDLKMPWWDRRVRQLTSSGVLQTRLHLTVTVDSDSLPIALLEHAHRSCGALAQHTDCGPDVVGLVCLKGAVHVGHPPYSTFDPREAVRALLGAKDGPSAELGRVVLVCGALALAGCDFCNVRGVTAEAAVGASTRMPPLETTLGFDKREALALADDLGMVCRKCAVRAPRCELLKAAWTTYYWAGFEFADLASFGF